MEILALAPQDFLPAWQRVDSWFEREVHDLVHPVFFHHFGGYAVKEDGELIGFLIGLRSQRNRDVAYIHLVAIHPQRRGQGIATNLYQRFEQQARSWGCGLIEAITTPDNEAALAFHSSRDFRETLVKDWAGPGEDRMVLRKRLDPSLSG